ncbi:MAG: sugar phosphate isomerase/epimerase [Cytophagaceae bacterium]|nr:sugar phosphate isomerase/epimerase [Cytophagaceae bacterium]
MISSVVSRRDWLKTSALLAGAALTEPAWALGDALKSDFSIGACDWSLKKMANPEAFEVARQIGLDGVQVSYNSAADEAYLSKKGNLDAIREASRRTGVRIASLAIGRLNDIPYKSEPRTEEWVSNVIDAAQALGAQTVLLAFFAKNDLRNDEMGKKAVIERLKKVASKAEKAGVTLSIESYLSAQEHLDIMQAVGSKAVKVYYDFRNATDAGYDIYQEIPLLGRANITEIHMKENGQLLGQGSLDWPRIRRALADIGYTGWMQIEGAMPNGAALVPSYQHNLKFLRGLFS